MEGLKVEEFKASWLLLKLGFELMSDLKAHAFRSKDYTFT